MLLAAAKQFFLQHGVARKYWIGFSGGLDSHVLLALCVALRAELNLNLSVIHVNHQLSDNASTWAAHCEKICHDYDINYIQKKIQLNLQAGDSLEEVARHQRYHIFSEYIQSGDMLLTAHHQDDQAETVLLQLLRGAGPKGLAAMPVIKSFHAGWHGRPLLNFTRAELQRYADTCALQWIDDESNQNISFARNFIRHNILSSLKSRWVSATSALARSAAHCAENQLLLEELARDLMQAAQGSRVNTLSIAKLKILSEAKQRLVLRQWIQDLHYALPDTKKMAAIQNEVLTAAQDRSPMVTWGNVMLRRYRDDLYLLSITPSSFDMSSLNLPANTIVRYRHECTQVKLATRGYLYLKNLFQEWGVPPWERDILPLIFLDDVLIAVPGYFQCSK